MPILMLALIALAVFGAIGALLLAAEILEHRKKSEQEKALGAKS
jgi:hypothetical protein